MGGKSFIRGIGAYVPERILESSELEERLGLEKGWIEGKTGIARRHIATDGQSVSDLAAEAARIRQRDAQVQITLADVKGATKTLPLSAVVRMYPANALDLPGKIGVYLSRWWEFLSEEPREANTEGGVWPAIFGTAAMTLLLVVVVAPFGIVTGGAKSVLLPYLSVTYLMNSMNRT